MKLIYVIPILLANFRVITGLENAATGVHRKLWYFDQDDLFLEHTTQGKRSLFFGWLVMNY